MSDTDDEADDNSNQKTDDGGKPALSSDLTKSYADLLRQCKGGPRRTVAVDTSKLKAAQGVRAFCAVCAANAPEVDLLLKLFGLQGWFADYAPHPPIPSSETAAQEYLWRCLDLLNQQIERYSDQELADIGREAMLDAGTHFSGKLIHSDARDASLFAPDAPSDQPHLSSRRLLQAGIRLPLDQTKNDNKGIYQRVLKVDSDDPLIQAAGLSHRVQSTIKQGVSAALRQASERRPAFVDHRLRQILLPVGDGYVALSPLPAAGFGVLLADAVQTYEQALADAAQDEQVADIVGAEQSAQPSKATARVFRRIGLPVGGAKPINATLHWNQIGFANPLLFSAPQRSADLRRAWRFLHRPWTAWIANKDLEGVVKQALAMEASAALQDSSATTATRVQASGALATWVRQCHAQAVGFAEDLAQSSWDAPKGKASQEGQEGQEQEGAISLEERVTQARKSEPPLLDLCLIRQNFGAEYRSAMADHLVELLRRKTVDPASGGGLFAAGAVAHRRARAAIEQVLELAP